MKKVALFAARAALEVMGCAAAFAAGLAIGVAM